MNPLAMEWASKLLPSTILSCQKMWCSQILDKIDEQDKHCQLTTGTIIKSLLHTCTLGNIGKNALTLMRRRAMSIRLFQLNLVPKFFICIGLLLIHRIIIILCIFDSVCLLSETSKISLIFPVCHVKTIFNAILRNYVTGPQHSSRGRSL